MDVEPKSFAGFQREAQRHMLDFLHKFSSTRAARSASSLEEDDEEEKD